MAVASDGALYRPFMTPPGQPSLAAVSPATTEATPASGVAPERFDVVDEAIDGTVWRSDDAAPLRELIAYAAAGRPLAGPIVNPLPLLQQPEVHRGRVFTVVGHAVRRDEPGDGDGHATYWIRPERGDRPVVVLTPIDSGANPSLTPGIDAEVPVTVDGVYLKRLAYRSGVGVDLAPVIVGRFRPAAVPPARVPPAPPRRTLLWLAAATLAGVGLAVGLTLASGRSARRLTRIRRDAEDTAHLRTLR